jgi:hypothetical protein
VIVSVMGIVEMRTMLRAALTNEQQGPVVANYKALEY